MAKPPESTKTSLRQRLAARAAERWPQLAAITVRWHGQFAYIAGQLPERLQELLGYNIYPPFLGYVDGVHPRKVLSKDS